MTSSARPIRVLTAVPLCDGHDSAISTINIELIHHGIEVIYLGYNRSVQDIVRAAVQEDVRAIGISSYNGGHVEFFSAVVAGLARHGVSDIGVFGGGGGTIHEQDVTRMRRSGVDRIFMPGESLSQIVEYVKQTYGRPRRNSSPDGNGRKSEWRRIGRMLTAAEQTPREATPTPSSARIFRSHRAGAGAVATVIGITGPGGSGKTTLIDELVLRALRGNPSARIAVLSHDPSIVGDGALLGDRATMIYSQDDRVFMRSLASRGQAGGLSAATAACLRVLKQVGAFDVIFVETVGIGQEAMPFIRGLVDQRILVMSPDYGSRLQLQKIAMLDLADIVVINKSDLAAARTASAEVQRRLADNRRDQRLVTTMAKRHGDEGVDALSALLRGTGGSPVALSENAHGRAAHATQEAAG